MISTERTATAAITTEMKRTNVDLLNIILDKKPHGNKIKLNADFKYTITIVESINIVHTFNKNNWPQTERLTYMDFSITENSYNNIK